MGSTPDYHSKATGRIIVIEDDKDINELIAYNLRKEGFDVEQVFDGWAAKARLKDERFDVVILDIMLPGIDGFDICREIKAGDNAVKTFVLMVSAKNGAQDKLYAYILGADCYLTKPFSIGALVNTVKEIIEMQNRKFVVKIK